MEKIVLHFKTGRMVGDGDNKHYRYYSNSSVVLHGMEGIRYIGDLISLLVYKYTPMLNDPGNKLGTWAKWLPEKIYEDVLAYDKQMSEADANGIIQKFKSTSSEWAYSVVSACSVFHNDNVTKDDISKMIESIYHDFEICVGADKEIYNISKNGRIIEKAVEYAYGNKELDPDDKDDCIMESLYPLMFIHNASVVERRLFYRGKSHDAIHEDLQLICRRQ